MAPSPPDASGSASVGRRREPEGARSSAQEAAEAHPCEAARKTVPAAALSPGSMEERSWGSPGGLRRGWAEEGGMILVEAVVLIPGAGEVLIRGAGGVPAGVGVVAAALTCCCR